MDQNSVRDVIEATHWPRLMAAIALGVLALFLVVATIGELKGLNYIGSGVAATNTISVSGEGEVFAVPDTATFSFTVQNTAKDVATAQAAATAAENTVVDYLKAQGIADTDIQTTDYTVDPQYEYQSAACPLSPAGGAPVYCPPGKQVLTGYQVSETVSVKVRDTSKAGAILAGVGSRGASSVSSLSLTVSNEKTLEIQARGKAIADAQAKAQSLAQQLGVTLVRVVGFSESGQPTPIYAPNGITMAAASAPAPAIPTGQNNITSNVNVTYEIR